MKIIQDERKFELYRILKNLYYLAEKNKYDDFLKLKRIYNKLLNDVFGNPTNGEESWEWDVARNGVDTIFTLRAHIDGSYIKNNPKEKEHFEKVIKSQMVESLKRIKKLEQYLK